MNKPHKHAALIKAWADGAEIQSRTLVDANTPLAKGWGEWKDSPNPSWSHDYYYDYRIKPAKKSAGELLRNACSLAGAPNMHWESLDKNTREFYEKSAITFLEAWKKENE